MFEKYYLAYGSNLNIEQMKERCPNSQVVGSALLKNYRLIYKGMNENSGFLTIEKCDGHIVPIGIYIVTFSDILKLDKYEGHPTFYDKMYTPIIINNKLYDALIYVMNESFNYALPTKSYINTCIQGYNDFGFDKSILDDALNITNEKINYNKKIK